MSAIPSVVLKVLDDWSIPYTAADDQELFEIMQSNPPASYSPKVANIIFLKDDIGQVQVVVPGNRMLDLTQMSHAFGRQFSAISADEMLKLKNKYQLTDFPALPQITSMETMIDQALLKENELFIVTGGEKTSGEQEWLKIPMDEFKALTTSSHLGNYTTPLRQDVRQKDADQDIDDVHSAIRQFTPKRIQQRLEETLDLPPLPETARKIIELRVDPNADTKALAHTVELDPGMSAQVLSWARSPYYGTRGEIKTVEEAVIRVLGFDLVINLALGLALGRSLSVPKEGPHGYTPFWQQAIVTASLCAELVRKIPIDQRPSQGLSYLCGLLHNFGFLILGQVFPPQFSLINRHIEANPHINRFYIEHYLLGMSREQCAAALMQQWQMPTELVVAMRQLHNPEYQEEHHTYANLLFIAVRLLRHQGIGDGPSEMIPDAMYESLGLKKEDALDAVNNVAERIDDLSDLVSLLNQSSSK
jgi:HD-like signal output (HDOD) protein/prolyl-tRNA editing enzyme YbaK/EbsC (Cys-tRNA(Pro) deacylase)